MNYGKYGHSQREDLINLTENLGMGLTPSPFWQWQNTGLSWYWTLLFSIFGQHHCNWTTLISSWINSLISVLMISLKVQDHPCPKNFVLKKGGHTDFISRLLISLWSGRGRSVWNSEVVSRRRKLFAAKTIKFSAALPPPTTKLRHSAWVPLNVWIEKKPKTY